MQKQNSDLVIRPYMHDDYPRIKQILEKRGLYYEPQDNQRRTEDKISRDWNSIFVVTRREEVVGTVSIMEDGRTAFIFRLAVAENSENAGIGIMLMDHAEKELFSRGYTEINILVDNEDRDLREYYQKQGYEEGHIYRWMVKEEGKERR